MDALKQAAPERAGDAGSVHELMLAKQTQMLYCNLPVSQAVALVNGAVLAALQAAVVETRQAIAWLACLAVITLVRLHLWLRFRRASPATSDTRRWLAYYQAAATGSAIVWGSS